MKHGKSYTAYRVYSSQTLAELRGAMTLTRKPFTPQCLCRYSGWFLLKGADLVTSPVANMLTVTTSNMPEWPFNVIFFFFLKGKRKETVIHSFSLPYLPIGGQMLDGHLTGLGSGQSYLGLHRGL